MADFRIGTGNTEDELGGSCSASKYKLKKINPHIEEGMLRVHRSQIKEFPVTEAGTIWINKVVLDDNTKYKDPRVHTNTKRWSIKLINEGK